MSPFPQGNSLTGVAYGNGVFVALALDGTVLISANNGITWSVNHVPDLEDLGPTDGASPAIAFGNGEFVAVGAGGGIATSTDGTTWQTQQAPTEQELLSVAFGNGEFVAVGANGAIVTSSNGTDWTAQSAGTANALWHVAFGDGKFVVASCGDIFTSRNGSSWTTTAFDGCLNGLAYGNGKFVATSGSYIEVSSDGITWTSAGSPSYNTLTGVAFGNGVFVVVGYGASPTIYYSSNGKTWYAASTVGTGTLSSVTFGNGTFVAVGSQQIVSSADGSQWSVDSGNAAFGSGLRCLVFGGHFWVAGGVREILHSADGTNWYHISVTNLGSLNGVVYGVTYANGRYVAVSTDLVLTSTDATSWSATPFAGLRAIAYARGLFVGAGVNDAIYTSPDAVNWTERYSGSNSSITLSAVTYAAGKFVAVGQAGGANEGTIVTSPDGIHWVAQPDGPLYGVTFGNGEFVAVGGHGIVRTSTDGVSWVKQASGSTATLLNVAFSGSGFTAVGRNAVQGMDQSTILSSADGSVWAFQPFYGMDQLNAVGFSTGSNAYGVVVGENGTILTDKP